MPRAATERQTASLRRGLSRGKYTRNSCQGKSEQGEEKTTRAYDSSVRVQVPVQPPPRCSLMPLWSATALRRSDEMTRRHGSCRTRLQRASVLTRGSARGDARPMEIPRGWVNRRLPQGGRRHARVPRLWVSYSKRPATRICRPKQKSPPWRMVAMASKLCGA